MGWLRCGLLILRRNTCMQIYVVDAFLGFLVRFFSSSFLLFSIFCELLLLFDYAWPWYRTHVI